MELYWRLILSTNDEKKANQIKDGFIASLSQSYDVVTFERYWKDKTKYLLEVSENLVVEDAAQLMDIIARKVFKASNLWNFNIIYEDNLLASLSGTCSESIKISGVEWLTFSIEQ